jgi:D-tyrosyl-tRNA(Tyr) deacylase
VIALLQRVSSARVQIDGQVVAEIGAGLLAFIGVTPADTDENAEKLVSRMLKYRIFADEAGKMNLSLRQIDGGLLLVPQFTLAADTHHGLRPGFSTAAAPEQGERLFNVALRAARALHTKIAAGRFGADMQVALTNDGPVTFWLEN